MAAKTFLNTALTISLLLIVLTFSARAHASTTTDSPNAHSIVKDNIEYYIQTDKAVYDVRENVQMLYIVTNVGEEHVEFIFTYGPLDNTCDWMVDKDGLRIWDNLGRSGTGAFTSFNLGPSQSYEYTHTWDMTDNDGDSISPGNYIVTGVLGYPSFNERYVPVSVPIDIIQESKIHYVNPGESIQARIDDPNVVDGDTIIVYPGTYLENINFNGKNITLSSTEPNDPNVVAATIIDGGQNGSVVTFQNGEDANCLLNGFTITNGYSGQGGGIYCGGLPDPPLPPPPLPIPPPPEPNFLAPRVSNCIISNNLAGVGGGMYSDLVSCPTLTNCAFIENRAGSGGGLYNDSSWLGQTGPILTNCTFIENSADSGGGIHNNWSSTAMLTNCTFIGNSAYYEGGGLCNLGDSNTILTDCTFNDNSAFVGGGCYNHWYSTITLTNCTLYNNWADYEGGGVYNILCISTMTGCIFTGNSAAYGGGMYNNQSNPTLTNCTFNANLVEYTGFVHYEDYGYQPSAGGGIYNDQSSPVLTNCSFNENSAWYGGAMYNDQSTLILTNCTLTGNSVIGTMDFRESSYGGAMYNYQSSLDLTNCAFNGNLADYGYGGGICNTSYSSLTITDCKFDENSAFYSGGGMSNFESSPILIKCTFTNNSSSGSLYWSTDGGGMYNSGSSTIVANCTFIANLADSGGGIYNLISNLTMSNCMFTGNYAYNSGGGIYNNNGIATLANCILWENMDGWSSLASRNESAQIYGQPVIVDYSCIQGWTGTLGGTGNIGDDPCFVVPGHFSSEPNCVSIPFEPYCVYVYDWTGGDYHLSPDSPCINAGDPNYIAGPNETDLDGNPRVIDGRIDMGAYEYIPPIPVEVKITPHTISLENSGKSITAYLWLPEDFNIIGLSDIDPNGILLEDQIQPEHFWFNEQKQMVISRFSREKVKAILDIGEVELTVGVRLTYGTFFMGTDIISVKSKGKPDKYAQATEPDPPDGATDVNTTADLSWIPAPLAASHDVYFGTVSPPPFIGNQTAAFFDPGIMDYETTYYWRIDEVNKWGTTTGQIWTFTTAKEPPPPPPT